MKLNEFIDKLVKFRDENNAGEFEVFTNELEYDVMCGEIQDVYRNPISLTDKELIFDKDNRLVQICTVDNSKEC